MNHYISTLALLFLVPASLCTAADWPAWRGPQGTGQSEEKAAPLAWSKSEHIKWKVKLDGPGNSTPIVVGEYVLITHAPADSNLRGLRCYDRASGQLLWKQEVPWTERETSHQTNPPCAGSPVSDGERVVAWYGSAGLYCYDLNGRVNWQKDLGPVDHIWGYGSSPMLYGDLVILNFGPGVNAFVVAFDKRTGQEAWRREFPGQKSKDAGEYRGSWSTPVVLKESSRDVLLLSLPNTLWAVEPKTGKDVWSCGGLGDLAYTSPIIAGDTVVTMSGFRGPAMAVRTGGSGDVTQTHQLWRHAMPKPPQRVGSGAIVGGNVFIHDEPYASCIDANTGEQRWQQRLGERSWCSMVHAAGRLYVSNEAGTTFVLEPSTEACKVLAENKLDELTRASLAISDGQIFVRTYEHLYCIE